MTALRALLIALVLTLPAPLRAHPHIFIDGGLGFVLDGENRLTHLTVTWIYDPFYSLVVLTEEGMDENGDGVLTQDEAANVARQQSQWIEGFDGDSYAWQNGARLGLSGPQDTRAALADDGRIVITFRRALDAPVPLSAGPVEAKAYDPTYYSLYTITQPPEVTGGQGCLARRVPVKMTPELAALQNELAAIGMDDTPADPQVGAQFADTLVVACD